MASTRAWPAQGPAVRDELAAWSTVRPPDRPLGTVPPLSTPPPEGWTELIDGRGVFIRRQQGPPDATPVWFVHGLAGASTDWTRLSGALSVLATGYSLDLPGSGRSDPPPQGRYSPQADADITAAAIDQVTGGPIHLVGNSYGGVVATLLAARRPDLVRTLTVISPAVPDLRLTRDRGADARLGLLLLPGAARVAVDQLSSIEPMERARGLGGVCFGRPESIIETDYQALALEHSWRAALPWTHAATVATLRGLMAGYLRRGSLSFTATAAQILAPTLVVWGTRDRLVDVRLSRRAAAAYPRAELLVIAGCGHVAQLEEPLATALGIAELWDGEYDADMFGDAIPAHTATSTRSDEANAEDHPGRAVPATRPAYGNLTP
ncbi:alpha/beta fold hydrolase [Nakamurella sp. GG22]